MAENYKYRAELPRIVETIHHKNALAALGKRGIQLAADASWQDICEYGDNDIQNSYRLTRTTYVGKTAVDGLFGTVDRKLVGSVPTPYIKDLTRNGGNIEDMHRHLQIHTRLRQDRVDVYMIPDVPPYAININRFTAAAVRRSRYNDVGTLEMAQQCGDGIFEFITEDVARNLTNALLNDRSYATFGRFT